MKLRSANNMYDTVVDIVCNVVVALAILFAVATVIYCTVSNIEQYNRRQHAIEMYQQLDEWAEHYGLIEPGVDYWSPNVASILAGRSFDDKPEHFNYVDWSSDALQSLSY